MRWEEHLQRLEDLVAGAARLPLTGKLLLDEEEVQQLLEELRRAIPEDVHHAKWVNRERERILAEARAEAEALIKEARLRIERLAKESTVLNEAERRAREILKEAEARAEELRGRGLQYLDDVLLRVELHLRKVADTLERNRQELKPRSDDVKKTG